MADEPKQNVEVHIDAAAGAVTYQYTSKPVGHYPHTRVFPGITEAKLSTGRTIARRRKVWSDLGVWVKQSNSSDVLPATS